MEAARAKPAWLVLAIASGACAAFNGVFAKLYVHQIKFLKIPSANANTITILFRTTTELTTSWASAISRGLHLSPSNKIVEFFIRGVCNPQSGITAMECTF